MTNETWTWARLDDERLALVTEAERTLGADYVLVFRRGVLRSDMAAASHLPIAPLDDSQLECLRGLEQAIDAVAVAYRQSA